jgi:hypothetical protein
MSGQVQVTIQARDFNMNSKSPLKGIAVPFIDGKHIGAEWEGNFSKDDQVTKFTKWLGKKCKISLKEAEKQTLDFIQRLQDQRNATEQEKPAPQPTEITLMDQAPQIICRPLTLIDDHAYAASWLWAEVKSYDPPEVIQELRVVIIRDDGKLLNLDDLEAEGLQVDLPDVPPENRLWRTRGVKAYCAGQRVDCPGLFDRLVSVYDYFLDFSQSFASQEDMCKLSACQSLATWFTAACSVIGYPWPSGGYGSGKTKWGNCWVDTSYLGVMVLAAGSFAAFRDLANYGATMLFDDAEKLDDPKKSDPDKLSLLLAGNRRGAMVPIKQPNPDGRGWTTKWLNAFCPRGFTSIDLPNPVLASRSIRMPLVRTIDEAKRNVDPESSRWPCDRGALQDDLWSMAVDLQAEMADIWSEFDDEPELGGRAFEPWRSILSVARLFERHGVTDLEERLRGVMRSYQEEREDQNVNDRSTQVLKAIIYRALPTDQKAGGDTSDASDASDTMLKVFLKEISQISEEPRVRVISGHIADSIKLMAEQEGWDVEWVSSTKVGRQLTSLRFKTDRKNKERTRTMHSAVFVDLCQAYGLVEKAKNNPEDPDKGVTSVISVTSVTNEGNEGNEGNDQQEWEEEL